MEVMFVFYDLLHTHGCINTLMLNNFVFYCMLAINLIKSATPTTFLFLWTNFSISTPHILNIDYVARESLEIN
jgi:hypothetical protein